MPRHVASKSGRTRPSKLARRVQTPLPEGYPALLASLKARIRGAQVRASLAITFHLAEMYWQLGRDIVERQERDGWGSAVIERLAADLRAEFPGMRGLATRNFHYARAFFLGYTRDAEAESSSQTSTCLILQQAAAELDGEHIPQSLTKIPWGHNMLLLDRLSDPALRLWYARKDYEGGWTRQTLADQIDSLLHLRTEQSHQVSSFARTLPHDQSELARNLLKDPYNFDFLTITDDVRERDLETALVRHMRQFLLELGVGFMFAGSQSCQTNSHRVREQPSHCGSARSRAASRASRN